MDPGFDHVGNRADIKKKDTRVRVCDYTYRGGAALL